MRFGLLLPLLILTWGCASNDAVDMLASGDQQAITRDGSPSLISAKRHVVMLQATDSQMESSGRPSFVLAVRNMQDTYLQFRPSDVRALRVQADGSQIALKVYSYEELVAEEKRRQTMAVVGAALAGAANSYNAANAGYSRTTGSFNAYNSYGGSAYGNYQSTTYNSYQAYSAQQLAAAQTSANFAAIRAEGSQNLMALRGSIIKAHTLSPGEWYGGEIILDKPKKSNGQVQYTILVELDGEEHAFTVRQRKIK
jgi:hypothetical protein